MASLYVQKGEKKGATFPLEKTVTLLIGREDQCDIVFDALSVSRTHAKIWNHDNEFFIEDEESRNKTYLNGTIITGKGPCPLRRGAVIRICDNEFEFQLEGDFDDDEGNSSTIEFTLNQSSKKILDTQSAEKLKQLVEITTQLTRSFDTDLILPQLVDSLFKVFEKADRAFLILIDESTGEPRPRVIRTRKEEDITDARFSESLINDCVETGQAFLCEDVGQMPAGDIADSVHKSLIRSLMGAPLIGFHDKVLGVIQIDTARTDHKFDENDLKFLMAVAGQAAMALENASQARLERDLSLAHEIQCGFLPKSLPVFKGYSFAARYEPAQEVGGDYYDFVPMPDSRLAVMIGDVAGKGVSAALLMAKVSSAARYALLSEKTPAAAVDQLNKQMCAIGTHDKFVTLTASIIDPKNHSVTFVNAGHNLPFLYRRATGTLEHALTATHSSLPLGVLEDAEYMSLTITLEPGDVVLLYTDGVTDSQNKKRVRFDPPGIRNSLKKGLFTPNSMAGTLFAAVEKHSKGCRQYDDITIVCLGRNI